MYEEVHKVHRKIKKHFKKITAGSMLFLMLATEVAEIAHIYKQVKNASYANQITAYTQTSPNIEEKAFETKPLTIKDILEYAGKTSALGKYVEAVAYAESRFNQQAVSYANAYGVMQVKKIAYDEVLRIYNIAKKHGKKWGKYLPYERWEDPGNWRHYESLKVGDEIKYVYLPFYFTWKTFFGNHIPSWEEVKKDPVTNIFIGTLYLLYLEQKYGRYQPIKTSKGIKYVKRKPSFFIF